MSVVMAQSIADDILRTLHEVGYVVVPKAPTMEMLYEAKEDAHSEDARGVWETMLKTYESTGNSPTGKG